MSENERVEERADRRSWTVSDARLTWLEVQRQTLVDLWGTLNVVIEKNKYYFMKSQEEKLKKLRRAITVLQTIFQTMAPFL